MMEAIAGGKRIANGVIPLILSQYAGIARTIKRVKNMASPSWACFLDFRLGFPISSVIA